MILADVGNTHITCVRDDTFPELSPWSIDTEHVSLRSLIVSFSSVPDENILVCSVVPKISDLFLKLKKNVRFIGTDIEVPIECRYDRRTVGIDRLVCAYAATLTHPGTRLVIDFGTAITMDILSPRGTYEGGLILPGVGSTLRVFSSCALLPEQIALPPEQQRDRSVIPRDTDESIRRGVREGFAEMINGMVEKYRRRLHFDRRAPILITGGDAPHIMPQLQFPSHYEPFLVFHGMRSLAGKLPPRKKF
ncbi:MAG: type III pantothenate kinase [Candidatus Omnitrophica bacterium]|nr:type III pantothenate kinase [Candidatus Omnitrophota bacterium]